MTKEELAARLNGRQYRNEITAGEAAEAKAAGLVVVYGYSDDNMEFEGAIRDEIGCYDGGTAYLTRDGLLQNDCDDDECPHFEKLKQKASTIEAIWSPGDEQYSWIYKTDIPHATFEIIEDDLPFCRGIVFALADVPA